MRICKCGETDQSNFYKDKRNRDGLRTDCKKCTSSRSSKYYNCKSQQILKANKKWAEENKDIKFKYDQQFRYENRELCNAWAAKYRAKKLNATLIGFDDEIKEVYKNCPKGYHVDHIMPLQGKTLSGLHVPWNLQYLTKEENLKKGNKICHEYYS